MAVFEAENDLDDHFGVYDTLDDLNVNFWRNFRSREAERAIECPSTIIDRQKAEDIMAVQFILIEYREKALSQAIYDKLEDGTFAGRIPVCEGVIAFGTTLRQCQDGVRSTLEDWIMVGLKLGHALPVIAGIDLNREPRREPGESV